MLITILVFIVPPICVLIKLYGWVAGWIEVLQAPAKERERLEIEAQLRHDAQAFEVERAERRRMLGIPEPRWARG